ncbi:MAG: ATP-binding protein [Elusimicrobiota bacterium]|nr:ATP-binding protein [Elusimicrobiota bacterium]
MVLQIWLDRELFLEKLPHRVIFDEIQYTPELLTYLKMLIDDSRDVKGRFILTGSQQFQMMKNISETLAGRAGLLSLLPLSYEEIKDRVSSKKKGGSLEIFVHSCLTGSYPELFTHSGYDSRAWYDSYVQTYLERDIKSIYNVGNLRDFHRFMRLLASRCSQQLNLSNLANDLGVAVNTVKKWVSLLEASCIIYLLSPYYKNIGKRITKSPKIYFTDCGLLCHLLNIRRRPDLLNSPLIGPLFENYCIQETIKYFDNMGLTAELYYIRTKTGKEIDLILDTQNGFVPIEIKFTKSPTRKMAESIEYFHKEIKKLSLAKGFLVSLIDTSLPLTENMTACNIHSYLGKLKKLV